MKKDTAFYDYVISDVLNDIEGISTKNLFSGWAVYKYGKVFALILNGELYFKTDTQNRPEFEKRGSHPFSFQKKDKTIITKYWTVPAEIMENKTELAKWVEVSLKVGS